MATDFFYLGTDGEVVAQTIEVEEEKVGVEHEEAALPQPEVAVQVADEGGYGCEAAGEGEERGVVYEFVAESVERLQVALTLADVFVVGFETA
jgi:hypothetical protein